jgi:MraZ protein
LLFLGEHRHSIDAKGRVSLPARFRSALPGPVVVVKGFDGELRVYTTEGYEGFLDELGSFDQFKGRVREVRRWFTANAAELDLDKAGRLNVPARFAEWAGLASDAVVLGSGDHIELWSPEKWDAYQTGIGNIADIAEEISDLGVF